ncbi:MAG: SymE family type I addiction module toxin [Agriterribacter sp.]
MQALKSCNTEPVRRITVCTKTSSRSTGQRAVQFPTLSLYGKWLQDTGFEIGHVVDIICEQGKLTITIAKEQRYKELKKLFQKERIEVV